MRVLQLCHSYYPPFLDCARQYAALFKGTQYQVTTVYLQGNFSQEVVEGSASEEVIFLGYKSSQIGGLKLGAISKIKALCKKNEFSFCIAHRVKSTYVALLATHLPIISVHHNYNDYSRWSRRLLVNYYQNRLLMLGVSNSVRDDLRRDLKGWPDDRIQTLYNRIDVDAVRSSLVSRVEARNALGISQNAWVVGNVGRLHRDKDQATLIRGFVQALPNLPAESLLVIIGAGSLEAKLKAQVAAANATHSIRFLGNVPHAARYFKAFDTFALTSDNEPFGMVLLEAMVAEVTVICSDNGGGAEVVNGVGTLFSFGHADQLATVLINILRNSKPTYFDVLQQQFSDVAAKKRFWHLYQTVVIPNV